MTVSSKACVRAGVAVLACALGATAVLTSAPTRPAAQPAVDRDYGITWLAGHQGEIPPRAKLRFGTDGRFSGFGGCNQLMGRYTSSADAYVLEAPARTRAMCGDTVMAFEDALVAVLGKATARQVGEEIVLSADGQRLLVLK